jgi:glutaredoxin 3
MSLQWIKSQPIVFKMKVECGRVYATSRPYCRAAKSLFAAKKIEFTELDVTEDPKLRIDMERLSGRRTVPQIFIDGNSIGGYDDACRLDACGELDRLLNEASGSS